MSDSMVPINVSMLHVPNAALVIPESAYLDDAQFAAHCDAMDEQCDTAADGSFITRHNVYLIMDVPTYPRYNGVRESDVPKLVERRESIALIVERVLRNHGVVNALVAPAIVEAFISGGI
jgi:hypothetical protein